MREGLAREFPEAKRAVAWTRGRIGGLRGEPVLWAAISAVGAGFLVGAVAQAAVAVANDAQLALRSPLPFTLFPLVTISGTAAAAAVALGVGGFRALALYVVYLALAVALAIPGVATFCERSTGQLGLPNLDRCTTVGFVTSLWPEFVGIGLGIALSRTILTRGIGINSLLRIAGGYAVAVFVASHVWAATVGQAADHPLPNVLTMAAGTAAAAVAAGVLAAHLPRGVRNSTLVGGISLLPWLTFQVPNGLRSLGPPEFVGPMVVIMATQPIAAALLVLTAAVAARRRFIPRDTA